MSDDTDALDELIDELEERATVSLVLADKMRKKGAKPTDTVSECLSDTDFADAIRIASAFHAPGGRRDH